MFRGFDSRTLALVQRAKNALLTDLATIEEETQTVNQYGGATHTWTEIASSVPCRLFTLGKSQNAAKQIAEQEGLVETYRIAFKLGTFTLAVGQRVTIGNEIYQIVDILSHRTDGDDMQATIKRDVR